ncbi:PLP-dependent cysteine synthase family protein [Arsenophonus endosymbiont of Aphis craccivora]|uniref:PLP-dependent cysteine synthase family protein n=1 Tax=Arsenophonus endosymbiont of Aphis craccivora TaxID=1231049 RepID=UPI001EE25325|nr:pyridoxal-phosphate dependent enzyme [Arsenophonus endosymbiont of Aphis craccivora]
MIFSKVTDLIGNTPVIQLPLTQADSRLYIKVEKNNPGGSMKDRMARNMIVAALKSGRIQPGGTIVESSSGNTGIGLALASIEFGLKFIAVVDHHAAQDKISIMRALGSEIRYVKGDYGENEVAVIERQRMAAEIASEISGAVFMNQSDNAANAGGYADLVSEIVHQIGRVDAWVGCIGTGGSITGIAHGLKIHITSQEQEHQKGIRLV